MFGDNIIYFVTIMIIWKKTKQYFCACPLSQPGSDTSTLDQEALSDLLIIAMSSHMHFILWASANHVLADVYYHKCSKSGPLGKC